MAAQRPNYSFSNIVDPYKGLQSTLSTIGTDLNAYEKQKSDAAQLAIANERANALLGIQQAQEGRAVSEFDLKEQQRKAVADAANLQSNITSGQPGQERFETGALGLLPQFETPEQAKLNAAFDKTQTDLTARIVAATTPAEKKALSNEYNTQVDLFRQSYGALDKQAPARDKLLEGIGTQYAQVAEASGYDGLKVNKADEGYEERVYRDLVAKGVPVATAVTQSKAQAALFKPAPLTAEQIKARDSATAAITENTKNQLKLVENKYSQGRVSGSGDSFGKDKYGKTKLKDAIADKGFSDSFISAGTDSQIVLDTGNKLISQYKNSGVREEDFSDALYELAEGRADATFKFDPSIDAKAWEKKAVEIAEARRAAKKDGSYSGSTYNKFGPGYTQEAAAILKAAEAAKATIAGRFTNPDRGDTGLTALEARLASLAKPAAAPVSSASKPVVGNVDVPTPNSAGPVITAAEKAAADQLSRDKLLTTDADNRRYNNLVEKTGINRVGTSTTVPEDVSTYVPNPQYGSSGNAARKALHDALTPGTTSIADTTSARRVVTKNAKAVTSALESYNPKVHGIKNRPGSSVRTGGMEEYLSKKGYSSDEITAMMSSSSIPAELRTKLQKELAKAD